MYPSIPRLAHSLAFFASVLLVAACACEIPRTSCCGRETPGQVVARHLLERYDDREPDCRASEDDRSPAPAVLCSGILLRATVRGPGYDVWNPNPSSPTANGIPFSWLRIDSGFSRLAFGLNNGFIILPYFYADSPSDGYTQLTVRCVFPFDGATNDRTGGDNDGCAEHPHVPNTGPCQAQGIDGADEWMARFGRGGLYGEQCGFTIAPGTPDAHLAFAAQSEIRRRLPSHFSMYNEVIVRSWTQGDVHLPLEAFFYLAGSASGRTDARENQKSFKDRTGRWVPVIEIRLPSSMGSPVSINYIDADQGIPD